MTTCTEMPVDRRAAAGVRRRSGEPALLFAAAVYGVSTTLSIVALHAVRPADLLAVEISGAAVMLLVTAAVRGRLRRRGALRQMLVGALVPGLAFLPPAAGRWPRHPHRTGPAAAPTATRPEGAEMINQTDRTPLFCDVTLAARIERAEAELIAACSEAAGRRAGQGGFVTPIAGGVASYAEPDSPLNKVAGLGFDSLLDSAELDAIERAFAARGAPVQAEVAALADPDLLDLLAGRGYRLVSFENVLDRALGGAVDDVTPRGVDVHRSGDDELETWLAVVVEASLHPDTQGVPWHEDFSRDILENSERDAAGLVQRYLARLDGVPAGGGSMRITDGIAQLTGAGTTPAFRRRGIQSALLSARLADATTGGCDIAVITVQPGSKSQQNAQRRGFDLLYTRAVMTLEPQPQPTEEGAHLRELRRS
jgi:GNAT superfamily N-acetyltransferase